MDVATIALIALAGATLYLSAHHGTLWLVRRQQSLHGWVALWGIAALSHQTGRLGHMWADTEADAVLWLKLSFGGILLSGAVAPFALRSLTGQYSHRWVLAALAPINVLLFALLYGEGLVTNTVRPYTDALGRSYLWVDIGPWTPLWLVWGISLLTYGHWLIGRSELVKPRERIVLYVATLLYVVPGIHDALLGMGLLESVTFFDYSFFFVVFAFAWIATQRFQEVHSDLENRVQHRTAQLAVALEEVQEAAAAKERFFANITHEIRTPLHGLQATTEMLSESVSDPEQRQLASIAVQSTRDLRVLVDDLLDASAMQAGKLSVHSAPMALRPFMETLVQQWEPKARRQGIELRHSLPDDSVVVLADELRLRQVFANLLSNAFKFTEEGTVSLDLTVEPEAVRFAVIDTGVGIEQHSQERIFDRFHHSGAAAGAGLGLTIAQGLTQAMGGELTVQSRVGEGTAFQFALPRAPEDDVVRPSLPPERGTGVVLVADDNPVNRAIAKLALTRLGVTVLEAGDGYEAVSLAMRGGLDLVLMDLHMPGLDGIAACRKIRAGRGEASRVPIVAMTASSDPEEHRRAREVGMNDLLGKPLELARFRRVVSEYVATHPTAPTPAFAHEGLRAMFIRDATARLVDVNPDDAAAVKAVAHAIRGAAASLEMEEIARLCADLEAAPAEAAGRLAELEGLLGAAAGTGDVSAAASQPH